MKPGLTHVLTLAICLAWSGTVSARSVTHAAWIPADQRTHQGIVDNEVDEVTHAYHANRVIMLMMNPQTGILEAAGASYHGKILSRGAATREGSCFHFDPGAILDTFTPGELLQCGIRNPTCVSAADLLQLFGAVANGGLLNGCQRKVFSQDRIEPMREDLLNLIYGKKNSLPLARVEGLRVAGAAGHGGRYPVTSCFAGYFPADAPRHVCVVIVEGADVLMKYQRGALLGAPFFSTVARKVHQLE